MKLKRCPTYVHAVNGSPIHQAVEVQKYAAPTKNALVTSTRMRPYPSLKLSANGRPPHLGRWYAVHFHQPGPDVLPSSPA